MRPSRPAPPPLDLTFAGRANSITLQELRLSCSHNPGVRFLDAHGKLEPAPFYDISLAVQDPLADEEEEEEKEYEGPPVPVRAAVPPATASPPPPTLPLCFCTERCWTFRSSAKYLGGVLGAVAAALMVFFLL